MECCYCLRKVQDLLADGKTPFERRFGEPLEGPIIPFGAMVEYHPISAKGPGIFLGYVLIKVKLPRIPRTHSKAATTCRE